MKIKKKVAAPVEKSVRIRFRDQEQLSLIARAAKMHNKSLNSLVIAICETAAQILVTIPPVDVDREISVAVRKALTGK